MVATKLKKILFGCLILSVSIQNAFSEMMEKGKTKFKFLLNFYHQNSDEGKQVFDNSGREEVNVAEPMLFIEHQITKDTNINGHFVFDFWTAASDTKLDTQTGASGPGKVAQTRTSGSVGVKRELDKWTLSGGVGFSSEYDYKSLNANLGVERSFAKDNFILGLGLQYYKDDVRLFEDLTPAGSALISDFVPRKILATSLTATQILTRKDLLQVGATYVEVKDNLESTASSVLVAGVREAEQLPDSRNRYALSSKWVHGLNETSALNFSYRYYFDEWDLDAHTLRAAYLKELNDDEDFFEVAFRLHEQTKVKYYQSSFQSSQEFMTSDSDMDKFKSYELGLFHSNNIDDKKVYNIELEDMIWNNGLTFYKRSNGLYYAYFQTSIGFKF